MLFAMPTIADTKALLSLKFCEEGPVVTTSYPSCIIFEKDGLSKKEAASFWKKEGSRSTFQQFRSES